MGIPILRGRTISAEDDSAAPVIVLSTLAARQLWPDTDIHISAQCYLQQFYQDLGFKPASEPYLEDDIPHLKMITPVQ